MRVLMVLLAVMVAPLLTVGAQGNSDHNCAKRDVKITNPTARERALAKCTIVTPPAGEDPSPPPTTGGWGGTATIDGLVFQASDPWPGLSGWTVTLSGSVSATSATTASGTYMFATLPAGEYTVCVTIPSTWTQTRPTFGTACPTGLGYTFSLEDGTGGSYVNFGMVPK